MVIWIVQSNLISESQLIGVVQALNNHSIPFQDVGVIPFTDEFVTPLEIDELSHFLLPYGSTKLCKIASKRKWKGLFFDTNLFRVDRWNSERDDMLNHDAEIMTVREAMNKYSKRPKDEDWFIRPIEDLKHFNGTVTTSEEIARWMSSVDTGNFDFDENVLVAVSAPKQILMEWRYFIVGGKIVSGSVYRARGRSVRERETDSATLAEAQKYADKWLPHENVVMDIALVENESLPKVIEFNCFNSSGFYDHDIEKIVLSITKHLK